MLFTIPGNPTGKARPRFARSGHVYTDSKTRAYEQLVQKYFAEAKGQKTDAPVMVRIQAYHKIPKAWNKASKMLALKGYILPTRKPDVDNVGKVVLDALNGVAWNDDTQVVSLTVHKHYAQNACVTVQITTLTKEFFEI